MQNGAVEKDFIDRMLENPFKEIKRAVKDSLRQCYLQELDKGKVTFILKMQMKEREVPDPTSTRMDATMEVTDIESEYQVKHQVVIDETSKGKFFDPEYALEFDSAGNVSFKKIKSAQTTIFDEESASNYGIHVNAAGEKVDFDSDPEAKDDPEPVDDLDDYNEYEFESSSEFEE